MIEFGKHVVPEDVLAAIGGILRTRDRRAAARKARADHKRLRSVRRKIARESRRRNRT